LGGLLWWVGWAGEAVTDKKDFGHSDGVSD
jgi:hypothetical protein